MQLNDVPEIMMLTDLRYKTSQLLKYMEQGKKVVIVKKGRQIGVIFPMDEVKKPQNRKIKVTIPKIEVEVDDV